MIKRYTIANISNDAEVVVQIENMDNHEESLKLSEAVARMFEQQKAYFTAQGEPIKNLAIQRLGYFEIVKPMDTGINVS